MSEPDLIRLSQGHLNLLSICPPKFQQAYIDSGSLPAPEHKESMDWGSRFHLLMQQRELALPIEPLLATETELDRSLKALIQAAPELAPNANAWREAEHCRTLSIDRFLFTVIYDLLIAAENNATILDWKTYRQPIGIKKLQHNWQTRLYLYVLAETSEYKPEQLQMTYWFVRSGNPTSVTIPYTQQQHRQTEKELTILLKDLTTWLQCRKQQVDFPHKANCSPKTCFFYRDFAEADDRQFDSIDEIEEVSI